MNFKRTMSSYIAVICFISFIAIIYDLHPAFAKTITTSSPKNNIYSNIDHYLQTNVQHAHIPALSINIVNKNEVLFSGNYGQCQSSDTPFLLGSVSKSFTAVCIMQLVEQQKIDLSAPISAYLPDAFDGDRIKVSQLLNHTSGLGEHQTLKDYKIINEQGIHHYANVNYSLLGEIIEAVSGTSYSSYISTNLLEPLGLTHTAATLDESMKNGLIDGYTNYWGIPIKTAHKYPSSKNCWITVPAGYLSASTNDLGKYLQMYLNNGNGIISEESIHTMFYGDTISVEDDIPYRYGYGWSEIKDPLSEPVLRHSGLIETGTSCIFILPERDLALAITANVNDYFVTNEMMDALGWGVVLMLLDSAPNEITANAYVRNHLWINLIMLVILFIAVLPFCFLHRYVPKSKCRKIFPNMLLLIPLHLLLPIFILLLVPIFFKTPLWVAKAFVPDVFITIAASSALLFINGLIKCVLCILYSAKAKTGEL